jgi:IS30 family transposase
MTPEVIAYINEKIEFDLSPEQITLIIEKDIGVSLSHERIYQHIYKDKNEGGSLYKHLRINHKKRYRRNRKKQNWRLKIPDRVDIDRRPDKINNRFRYGDWEADLVVGSDQKRFLVTLTERKSLFEVAGFVDGKSSGAVSKKIKELLLEFKKRVYSITYDNGPEFSMHMHTNEVLNCYSYFAKPYHAWERGANENQNGLLRQYFPKGTDFRNYSEGDVERAIYRMNNRPRKSRGGKTPNELLYRVLART